jgi:hypothetical protein
MKILIGCEYSGRVRDAFARLGHTAISCDLRATEARRVGTFRATCWTSSSRVPRAST